MVLSLWTMLSAWWTIHSLALHPLSTFHDDSEYESSFDEHISCAFLSQRDYGVLSWTASSTRIHTWSYCEDFRESFTITDIFIIDSSSSIPIATKIYKWEHYHSEWSKRRPLTPTNACCAQVFSTPVLIPDSLETVILCQLTPASYHGFLRGTGNTVTCMLTCPQWILLYLQ